ncbi:MAG: hypothetical protein JWO05_344 [Gemmatimonadetes bacterium]|nr:hypothetical protein [Gemmatimonadota bacterium]
MRVRARTLPILAAMASGIRDLKVWQESVALAADCVKALKVANRRELMAVADETLRIALAVPSHVADGYARYAPVEQREAYRAARRELLRLEGALAVARRADLIPAQAHAMLSDRITIVLRLIGGYLVYLDRETGDEGNGG